MKISKVWAIYFSPNGGVEKVALTVAQTLAETLGAPLTKLDVTLPAARADAHTFGGEDLVVFAVPTYAGRIPNKLLPYVQSNFTGNGALAVPVTVFGNRSFDNSLSELNGELAAHGFATVAGAGVVAQHAFTKELAGGRPNADDVADLQVFAKKIAEKVNALTAAPAEPVTVKGEWPAGPYYTPKGTDGKPAVFLKAKPKTDADKCTKCGICAKVCPVGSIPADNVTECTGICIKCSACINKCPEQAKYFDDAAFLSHVEMLKQNFTRTARSEFFL